MPDDDDQRPQNVLARFGFSADEITALVKSGLIGQ
jgi:alpha-methylacyl-CoA racemase